MKNYEGVLAQISINNTEDLEIFKNFIESVCINKEQTDNINETEKCLLININTLDEKEINLITSSIHKGFIKPICNNYKIKNYSKCLLLYKDMIFHIYCVCSMLNNEQDETLKNIMNSDVFKLTLEKEYTDETQTIKDVLPKILTSLSENIVEDNLLISSSLENNQNDDKHLLSLCLYEGFIKPMQSAIEKKDIITVKNLYFCMIQYLIELSNEKQEYNPKNKQRK